MDLAQLRALRKNSGNTLAKIASELQKQDSYRKDDDRFWKLEGDKLGNGSAVIRFLPSMKEGELPWVKVYSHGFKGPSGKWYIENCLTTIGQADPVVEHCNELYSTGLESDKKIAGERKRKVAYIANVLVISDSKNPENEGTVRLFKFGKKIFDKIKDAMQPQYEDEEPVNPFDFWKGANFKLKIRNVEGYRNYDKSEFDSASTLSDEDDELEALWNKEYSLQEFLDPKNFKTYEELKAKLESVISAAGAPTARADEVDLDEDTPRAAIKAKPKAKVPEIDLDEDDESLSYFAKLANDD